MAWTFPEDRPFDVRTKDTEYLNCRFVAADASHLTVDRDYLCILGRMHRIRTQVAIEDIHAVHEHAVAGVREESHARPSPEASPLTEPAEVHGHLRPRPGESAGEVPAA